MECHCSTFQISTDGYVSLSSPSSSEFTQFPLPAPNTSPIIAPLWMRTTSLQIVFSNTLDYRVADDIETLSAVSAIIVEFNSELNDFRPRIVTIATLFFVADFEVWVLDLVLVKVIELLPSPIILAEI